MSDTLALPGRRAQRDILRTDLQALYAREHLLATRVRSLPAGREPFGTRSFAAIPVDDLAVGAGSTTGVLCHRFTTKIDLLAVVFEHVHEELLVCRRGKRAGEEAR